MSEHELKTWPGPFAEIRRGTKTHEIRRFDRPFAVGDTLRLREYAPANERDLPGRYTGEEIGVLVTSIAVGSWGLPPDLCVMSIRAIADATTRAPERVTDEELAEIGRLDNDATPGPWIDTGDAVISDAERDCDDMSYVVVEPFCRCADRAFIAAARTLLPRLAASERARRKNDAAIGRLLDEAGVTAREGETLLERVAALTVDACASRMTCERLIAERNEQRARAEQAEAKLAALRAPVDVDADPLTCAVLDAADGIYPSEVPPGSRYERVAAVLLPHVERAARLAREAEGLREQIAAVIQAAHEAGWNGVENSKILAVFVQNMGADLATSRAENERLEREAEGLRAEVYRLNAARVMAEEALDRGRKWHEKRTADLDAARAELAKVVLERDAVRLRCDLRIAERDEALQQLDAARTEIDCMRKTNEKDREAMNEWAKSDARARAEVDRLRADLARETARRDDQIGQLERRLGERETEATQYRVAASRAAEVLRAVEWSGVADGGDPGPEPGGCPCCGADKPGPHASTCTLDACLVGSPCADTAALWRVLALARGAIASDEGFTDADLGRTVAQAAEQLRALGHDPDDIWIEPSDAEPITPRGQP